MATDEGLVKVRTARHNIELLRNRRDFLSSRIEYRKVQHTDAVNTFDEREIAAIEWALPVLEAEWHNLVRLRANLERVESRLVNLERRDVTEDRGGPRLWEHAKGPPLLLPQWAIDRCEAGGLDVETLARAWGFDGFALYGS